MLSGGAPTVTSSKRNGIEDKLDASVSQAEAWGGSVLGIPACLRSFRDFNFAVKNLSTSFWQTTASRPERRITLPEVCIKHVSFALAFG